jgi:hypothetical protein
MSLVDTLAYSSNLLILFIIVVLLRTIVTFQAIRVVVLCRKLQLTGWSVTVMSPCRSP